jgi:hypothetical protein
MINCLFADGAGELLHDGPSIVSIVDDVDGVLVGVVGGVLPRLLAEKAL